MVNHLSSHDRSRIICMAYDWWFKQSTIATKINCSASSFNYTSKDWKKHGVIEELHRSGRPPRNDISRRYNNWIFLLIKEYRRATSWTLRIKLKSSFNIIYPEEESMNFVINRVLINPHIIVCQNYLMPLMPRESSV